MEAKNAPAIIEEVDVVNVDKAMDDWQAYQKLTHELLDDSDYQNIKGKKFKKKSAWRKYMRAFNISTKVIDKEIIRNDRGMVTEASFTVLAWTPAGRQSDGWGNCSKFENRGFNKPNHDIPATAMTRATNRAISDLIGAGEVSAEEMDHNKYKKKPSSGQNGKKPASSKPKPATDEEAANDIIDADFKVKDKKPKPAKKDDAEQVNMAPINAQELKGINEEYDKWLNTVEDLEVTQDEAYNQAQELLGEQKLTPTEIKKVEEALGMKVE